MLGVAPAGVKVLGCREEEVAGGRRVVVVSLRAKAGRHDRCPGCGCRCPAYDRGRVRRWRALDAGRQQVFIEARVPRVSCAEHGVVTAAVPWARHEARHTYAFEQVAAWCATQMSITAATALLRCSWRTIGTMVARVAADLQAAAAEAGDDGLGGLRRIGIDEISYRRGHTYLTVVVDHDSRRLVWAAPGRDRATLGSFFTALGPERAAALTHVTSDSAAWIAGPVTRHAPDAVHCADPFHVVRWAGEAVNLVRRQVWNQVRRTKAQGGGANRPATGEGKIINKGTWALRKNRQDWTENQAAAMAWIATNHPRLHRAWRLKESLRAVFAAARKDCQAALRLLERWIRWARRSRLPEFVEVARKITTHRAAIEASITHGLSNGLTESANTKIRLITRRGYGFRNVHALIALAKLSLGIHKPALPT